ncbi:hypothetical protein DPMN_124353 [Dreissena polymorpha]|uniref:Uncharacterized protein n=1 Tax=Dreissena polymorpha TaxID=45954 RepID=A0A9D4GW84_DREPO|nr:hypothetical protein DPMN_124353 [Dreissena polymorpha]
MTGRTKELVIHRVMAHSATLGGMVLVVLLDAVGLLGVVPTVIGDGKEHSRTEEDEEETIIS